MRVVAMIHMRGGSTRLPGKQLYKIGGKMIIERQIEMCLDSPCVSDVVFSSDSPRMRRIANQYNGRVSIIERPAEFCDEAKDIIIRRDVMPHTIRCWRTMSGCRDRVMAFFVQEFILEPSIIEMTFEAAMKNQNGWVETVKLECHSHPEYQLKLDENNKMVKASRGGSMYETSESKRFDDVYTSTHGICGRFDPVYSMDEYGVIIPEDAVVEIHDIHDYIKAKAYWEHRQSPIEKLVVTHDEV